LEIPTAETSGEISLYFHIPFCSRKCPYCHFFVLPNREDLKEKLKAGIQLELQRVLPLLKGKKLISIYFGGGTSSLFPEGIKKILQEISPSTEVEITLEANPEDLTLDLLSYYRDIGINRLSIGVQSLYNPSLKTIGRTHSAEKAIRAITDARKAKFENISIDLMYDLPNQDLKSWEYTLDAIKELPITHLSLYNLTLDPPSLYYKERERIQKEQPTGEVSFKMLRAAVIALEELGLHRYEISAFAKPGYYSRHNTGYWLGRPFFGLGPSAFSYIDKKRYRNIPHLNKYLTALEEDRAPVDFEEKLECEAATNEHLCIQLRLIQGVDLNTFEKKWGPISKKPIQALIEQGLLEQNGTRLRLSEKGLYFYDSVAVELI